MRLISSIPELIKAGEDWLSPAILIEKWEALATTSAGSWQSGASHLYAVTKDKDSGQRFTECDLAWCSGLPHYLGSLLGWSMAHYARRGLLTDELSARVKAVEKRLFSVQVERPAVAGLQWAAKNDDFARSLFLGQLGLFFTGLETWQYGAVNSMSYMVSLARTTFYGGLGASRVDDHESLLNLVSLGEEVRDLRLVQFAASILRPPEEVLILVNSTKLLTSWDEGSLLSSWSGSPLVMAYADHRLLTITAYEKASLKNTAEDVQHIIALKWADRCYNFGLDIVRSIALTKNYGDSSQEYRWLLNFDGLRPEPMIGIIKEEELREAYLQAHWRLDVLRKVNQFSGVNLWNAFRPAAPDGAKQVNAFEDARQSALSEWINPASLLFEIEAKALTHCWFTAADCWQTPEKASADSFLSLTQLMMLSAEAFENNHEENRQMLSGFSGWLNCFSENVPIAGPPVSVQDGFLKKDVVVALHSLFGIYSRPEPEGKNLWASWWTVICRRYPEFLPALDMAMQAEIMKKYDKEEPGLQNDVAQKLQSSTAVYKNIMLSLDVAKKENLVIVINKPARPRL